MEPDVSLPLLLPSKLRYWESVSQYGCTRVQQHLYQTEAIGSGQESGFSKEHANMNLWTPWDRESIFLPASSMHQDIAHSCPRSLPALIPSDARDPADPRKLQNRSNKEEVTPHPAVNLFSRPRLLHQSGNLSPSGPMRGQTHMLMYVCEASSFLRLNRSKQVPQR